MIVVEKIERFIIYTLIAMLLVTVVLGTVELGRVLVVTIMQPPFVQIEPEALFQSFGVFLVILIGLELLKLLKLQVLHHNLRAEFVIEVAFIAVCNKVVTFDPKAMSAETLIGLAVLLMGLAAGYYVFNKARNDVSKRDA